MACETNDRKMGFIYILRFPNGKVYIGQTRKDFRKRWQLHRVRANHSWAVARAIKKYGWENVKKEVVVELPDNELDAFEVLLIDVYGSVRPGGYNITPGGDFNPMNSEEIRVRQLDAVRDDEHRKNQSEHTKTWHQDAEKHANWKEKNALANQSQAKAAKLSIATTSSWKDEETRKKRVDGMQRAFSDPKIAKKRADAAAAGNETPEAKAKKHATMLRKREELLAKLPEEQREAKRADLEKRAAWQALKQTLSKEEIEAHIRANKVAKREAILAQLPESKREAKRRALDRNLAKANAKYAREHAK